MKMSTQRDELYCTCSTCSPGVWLTFVPLWQKIKPKSCRLISTLCEPVLGSPPLEQTPVGAKVNGTGRDSPGRQRSEPAIESVGKLPVNNVISFHSQG